MIEKEQVKTAVDALLALMKSKDENVLFDQPQKIDVQFTLKQIPKLKHKTIPMDLPHSLHYDTREVCVFVKDLDKKNREYEPTVQHYETLFKEKKVEHISKIIPLKALRTDYSMHSNKRSLAKSYDLFLGDKCVMGLLPGILGKIFYEKKKTVPVAVNLGLKDLKTEIDKVVNNARCVLQGSGSSSMVCIGNNTMNKNALVSNVLSVCKQIAEKVPGGKANIRNMYLKSTDTPAIPLCMNLESPNEVVLPKVEHTQLETFVDEITTLEEGKVMIRADGMIKVVGVKKEPETDDMSDEDDDVDNDDDSSSDDDKAPKPTKAKDGDEEEEETKVFQKSNQKPGKEIGKGPNQAKNKRKRGNEDKDDKTVAKKKQKPAAAKKQQAQNPNSAKKAVPAKQPASGKKPASAKQVDSNKTQGSAKKAVPAKQPASGKKPASAKQVDSNKTPGSAKKAVPAKQPASGKKPTSAKQVDSNKTPVTDKKPMSGGGGKKNIKRPKNA